MTVPTTSITWPQREPGFKQFLAGMSNDSLLRLARCLWWEALQHGHPLLEEDARMLELASAECDRRELSAQFEQLEGLMRAELLAKGLLKPAPHLGARPANGGR